MRAAGGNLSDQHEQSPTVVVVDDHDLVRRAVIGSLENAGIPVIGEAGDGEEAVRVVAEKAPDIVLMDLTMPGISGVEATQRLSTLAPKSRVVVLTGSSGEHDVLEAILAGATGYLLKDAGPDEIVAAVRRVAGGESVISPRIAGRLLERIRERDAGGRLRPGDTADAIRATLTGRELEVLKLMASGKDNSDIAGELFLSPKTVKNHVANILAKLQLENRIQAAVHAVRSGIV
jgi:DNA-binding NarL/FixJ family response regulator